MAFQVPTSSNVRLFLHYLGKQNRRSMHWQRSTNWRLESLDRIKNLMTTVWDNEVHCLLTYCSTSCYQMRHWWHVRVSAVQRTSASAREAIELLECETSDFISPNLWSPTALISIRSITISGASCNSRSIRQRSRMWMNSRSNRLKSGLVWSRTLLTLLSVHGETVCMLVFARRADISNIDCSSWTTGHLDKQSQPEWLKCKPNVIYACYFNKVIILPCIKCNISLVIMFWFPQVV